MAHFCIFDCICRGRGRGGGKGGFAEDVVADLNVQLT